MAAGWQVDRVEEAQLRLKHFHGWGRENKIGVDKVYEKQVELRLTKSNISISEKVTYLVFGALEKKDSCVNCIYL